MYAMCVFVGLFSHPATLIHPDAITRTLLLVRALMMVSVRRTETPLAKLAPRVSVVPSTPGWVPIIGAVVLGVCAP